VALWYAEHGIPTFPLRPGTKVPYRGSHGVDDATTDTLQVWEWWQLRPTANIGLATGHRFDVIDVDGPQGNATLAREGLAACQCTDYRDDPPCPVHDPASPDFNPYRGIEGLLGVVSTPRPGGRHLYVAPRAWPNGAGMGEAGGIDYRGLGGYVVAPPSWSDGAHPGLYVWVRSLELP